MPASTNPDVGPQAFPTKVNNDRLRPLPTDDRLRPLPEIHEFEYGKASNKEIIAALIKTGGVIVRKAVSQEHLQQIEADTRPYLGHFQESNEGDRLNHIFSERSKRVLGLATKSKTFMEQVVQHPTFKAVRDHILTARTSFWFGDDYTRVSSKPQLDNTIVFSVRPGAPNQGLHRDDTPQHNVCTRKTASQYTIGQDTQVGWFVAGKPSTKANGATRFIPGSHLWDNDTPPNESLTVPLELNKGDAFVILASVYHGASANTTTDQERLLYSCFFTKGYLRQGENQYLAHNWEKLSKMGYDDAMLEDIGFNLGEPLSGYIDFKHPLEYLREI